MYSSNKPKIKSKSQSVSARLYTPKPEAETRQSERELKEQLQLLESENSELRYRLDSLRKAKNQLIIKREKAPINAFPFVQTLPVPSPLSQGSRDQLSLEEEELELRLFELERAWRERLEETECNLLREHEREVQLLEREKGELKGELEIVRIEKGELVRELENKESKWLEEVQRLESTVSECKREEGSYEELILECRELRKLVRDQELRVENLLAENCHLRGTMGKREEEWKVREEELSLELRNAWGQRYHEWITKAERKMQELQEMNQILQDMMDKRVAQITDKQ